MRLYMVICLFSLMRLSCAGIKKKKKNETLTKVWIAKEEALNFVKRDALKEAADELRGKCCDGTTCTWEQRAETSESHGWPNVQKGLCKVSIQEARSCRCKTSVLSGQNVYECGSDAEVMHNYCPNPCSDSQFYCDAGRESCIPKSQHCDSNNDCNNWLDEHECTIATNRDQAEIESKTKLSIKGHENPYLGLVYIDGRPVCDDSFGGNTPTIICKTIHRQKENVGGVKLRQGLAGTDKNNYIMSSVLCSGDEDYIGECKHKTWNECDDTNDAAGVACLDAATLQLHGDKPYEGYAYISYLPFVNSQLIYGWSIEVVKVICTQLYSSNFDRGREGVPAFTHDANKVNMRSGQYYANAACQGSENMITDCELGSNKASGQWNFLAFAQCASCTPQNLLEIVQSLSFAGTAQAILQSIQNAKDKLDDDCRAWTDCLEHRPQYPEFCLVRAFLEDALVSAKPSAKRNKVVITTSVDPMGLLQNNFMKQQFAEISTQVDELGSTITTKMGEYFATLAEYDRNLAIADVEYNHVSWKAADNILKGKQIELAGAIKDIFGYAFSITVANILQNLQQLCLAMVDLVSLGAGISPGGNLNDVLDRITALANSGNVFVKLGFLHNVFLPKMKSKGKIIADKIETNRDVFSNLHRLLRIAENELTLDDFSKEDAKAFLTAYNSFSPALVSHEVNEYMTLISTMLDEACGVIEGENTAAGAAVAFLSTAQGSCPKAKVVAAVIEGLMDDMAEKQIDLMDACARVCRARIAETKALELKNSVIDSSSAHQKLKKEIRKWQVMYLIRGEKVILIESACNYLTYMHHYNLPGNIKCPDLLSNPDGDVSSITKAVKYDMCTGPNMHNREDMFIIPAHFGGENVAGSINLQELFRVVDGRTDGSTLFKIPADWLSTYDWIDDRQTGPFFLKRLNIYLPPSSENPHWYKFKLKLLDSGFPGKSYMIDSGALIISRLTENAGAGCSNRESNPYNVEACNTQLGDICITTDGEINSPLLPKLENSNWAVTLEGQYQLTDMRAEGTVYLYARAKYCFKGNPASRKKRRAHKIPAHHPTCCSTENKFFNLITKECQSCTSPASEVRLHDYFCEKCPKGYTGDSSYLFGCQKCAANTYKDVEGSAACTPCPDGKEASPGSTKCVGEEEEDGKKKKRNEKKKKKKRQKDQFIRTV